MRKELSKHELAMYATPILKAQGFLKKGGRGKQPVPAGKSYINILLFAVKLLFSTDTRPIALSE